MSDDVKYFNVKNTSLRLVSFAGKLIVPGEVVAVVDDPITQDKDGNDIGGYNRATVEQDLFLEETDEEVTNPVEPAEKPVAAKTTKAKQTASTAKTQTGAGWAAKQ